MKKHVLRIREADKFVFDSLKKGKKVIETRAATDKCKKIRPADILIFVCGGEKLEKRVKQAAYFKTIDEMNRQIDFKKIMPFVNSVEEMGKVYYSFPGYQEKIKKFGLLAFELE